MKRTAALGLATVQCMAVTSEHTAIFTHHNTQLGEHSCRLNSTQGPLAHNNNTRHVVCGKQLHSVQHRSQPATPLIRKAKAAARRTDQLQDSACRLTTHLPVPTKLTVPCSVSSTSVATMVMHPPCTLWGGLQPGGDTASTVRNTLWQPAQCGAAPPWSCLRPTHPVVAQGAALSCRNAGHAQLQVNHQQGCGGLRGFPLLYLICAPTPRTLSTQPLTQHRFMQPPLHGLTIDLLMCNCRSKTPRGR
jgi:hypothetical protein